MSDNGATKNGAFKNGDRVVTNTGTHGIIRRLLRGPNAPWCEVRIAKPPHTIYCLKTDLQRYGSAEWHGKWSGPTPEAS
jgi:hypothetical protein